MKASFTAVVLTIVCLVACGTYEIVSVVSSSVAAQIDK